MIDRTNLIKSFLGSLNGLTLLSDFKTRIAAEKAIKKELELKTSITEAAPISSDITFKLNELIQSDNKAEILALIDSYENKFIKALSDMSLLIEDCLITILSLIDKERERPIINVVETPSVAAIKQVDTVGGATNEFIIPKIKVDNTSISYNEKGELLSTYNLSNTNLYVDKNNNNIVQVIGLLLSSGQVLSADMLNRDLTNATNGILILKSKLESVLTKLNGSYSYMASSDFKKAKLDLAALDEFAIKCLSNSTIYVKRDQIPVGTRIKNTYNNHIWVFNKLSLNGLTTYKWEDFGADSVCVADNSGTLGLVKGSAERLRGYVDVNGVISINGLEEELTNILTTIKTLEDNLISYSEDINLHLRNLDIRLSVLEGR